MQIASVDAHVLLLFLVQVAVLLCAALLLGRLALRLKMPAIVGELTAGVLLGPSALGLLVPSFTHWLLPVGQRTVILGGIGQFAVILLVGVAGVHLDRGLLRRQGPLAFRLGIVGLVIPLALGVATGYLVPGSLLSTGSGRTVFACFLGVALSVSAIPVIAKTLLDMDLLHRDVGQLILTSGAISDTIGWLLLSLVAAMATTGLRAGGIAAAVGKLVLVVLVAIGPARILVRRVIERAARSGDATVTVVTVIALLAGAACTLALGLEAPLGAFITGVLISLCPAVSAASLATLRTVVAAVLAPIFFATAGLSVDLTKLGQPALVLAGLAVIAVAALGKFLGAFVGAWRSRLSRPEIVAVGAGMNSRGVVEIVVASVGLRLGVLNTGTYTIIVALAIITSLSAAPILRVAMRRAHQTAEEELRRETYLAVPVPAGSVPGGGA